MTKSKYTFWEKLQDSSIEKITIPRYQRDYAQGRPENLDIARSFVIDLLSALRNGKELSLGLLYGCEKKNELQIVDGQQRFTMLWLFHLYIARNAEALYADIEILSKFTYNTRLAAKRFCEFLTLDTRLTSLSMADIKTNINFQRTWLQDPTVSNMLQVLDIMDKKIEKKECISLLDKLKSDSCPIYFDYLAIRDITSDKIYMLMNSRGLELTDFERFKSEMYAHIPAENQSLKDKIDVKYTDSFWEILNFNNENEMKGEDLDHALLTYIEEFARFKAFKEGEEYKSSMADYQSKWIAWFKSNALCLELEQKTDALFQYASKDKSKQLLKILNEKISYDERLHLYAHIEFFSKITPNSNWEPLYTIWLRIVTNIINQTRNSADNYKAMLQLIDTINSHICFEVDYDIYSAIGNSNDDKRNEQWLQEKLKARLIASGTIEENEIIAAENINGFNGNIYFLLNFEETKEETFNQEKFSQYTSIARCLLDNALDDKSNFVENYLLVRAILTYEPKITNALYLYDKHIYLYNYLNDSSNNISYKELRKAVRKLFIDIAVGSARDMKSFLQYKVDTYLLQEDKKNIAYWRLVHHYKLLSISTNYNYIYTDWNDRMRLCLGKNRNTLDYDLCGVHCEDVVQIYDLFGVKDRLGEIFRKDGDVFYRSWLPCYFVFNNITISVILTDGYVNIGIEAESNSDCSTLIDRWPASEDGYWSSVLIFPIGRYADYEIEIEEYKKNIEALTLTTGGNE